MMWAHTLHVSGQVDCTDVGTHTPCSILISFHDVGTHTPCEWSSRL